MNPIFEKEPYKSFLNKYQSSDSREAYASDLKLFDAHIGGKDPYVATKEELESFITNMQVAGKADRTIRRRMACLKKLYARAMKLEKIIKDPTTIFDELGTRVPQRNPKALTKEQREHLKQSLMWNTPLNIRISLMVLLGLHCGLRRNEIRKLTWEDIDFEKKKLRTIGKGNKEAYLTMSKLLTSKLLKYKATGLIMGEVSRSTLGYWNSHVVKEWCGWGKEVVYSCHCLRHSFVTELIEGGTDINVVMELARHANIATTNGYFKLKEGKKEADYSAVFDK